MGVEGIKSPLGDPGELVAHVDDHTANGDLYQPWDVALWAATVSVFGTMWHLCEYVYGGACVVCWCMYMHTRVYRGLRMTLVVFLDFTQPCILRQGLSPSLE